MIEYKIYRYASVQLKGYEQRAEKSFFKAPQIPEEVLAYKEEVDPAQLLSGVSMERLYEAFQFVMRRREAKKDPIRSDFGEIHNRYTYREDKIKEIDAYIQTGRNISFFQIIRIQKNQGSGNRCFLINPGIDEAKQDPSISKV